MTAVLIPISRGLVTRVSPEDESLVLSRRWFATPRNSRLGGFYVGRSEGGRMSYLHRLLLKASPSELVDHIDGDGLNNQRDNLRLATASLNCANRKGYTPASGYRGVYRQENGRYIARIWANRKSERGGIFDDPIAAARRYDEMAIRHFGAFATLNFPERAA